MCYHLKVLLMLSAKSAWRLTPRGIREPAPQGAAASFVAPVERAAILDPTFAY
jgi:hypothetical protein